MNSSKIENEIENLALKFLELNDFPKRQIRQDSNITVKDQDIFRGQSSNSLLHSRTRSKILSIVSNNVVLAEYSLDFLQNKKVTLYQVPQKFIDDSDDVAEESDEGGLNEDEKEILTFELDYGNIYDIIKEFYSPLMKIIKNIDNISKANISNIEIFLNRESVFEIANYNGFEHFKMLEMITIGFLIYLYQIKLNLYFDFSTAMPCEDVAEIYKLIVICVMSLYDSLMGILLFNANIKNLNKQSEEEKKITNEDLCIEYMRNYYKNSFKPSNEQIENKLSDNFYNIKDNLIKLTEIVINYLYQSVNNVSVSAFSAEFVDEISYFEKLILLLKENKEDVSYSEIKNDVKKSFDVVINLLNQSKISFPYLPPINAQRYKYTLVVDLDETLVHYVEEETKAYVQVRPFADYFLSEMGKYFEIVIFTAAAEDYADLVLKELDKKNNISYRLYRKHTEQKNGVFLKDLSKLGRDITKVCIIDNNRENFDLQPENGLHISSFLGEQNDTELFLLSKDLLMIINDDKDDIRKRLDVIRKKMEARYISKENGNANE